jgi:hypothetical protein
MVLTLESASLRLFTASMMMATELAKMPTPALNAANNTLAMMPIQLVLIICEERSMIWFFVLVPGFICDIAKNFAIDKILTYN